MKATELIDTLKYFMVEHGNKDIMFAVGEKQLDEVAVGYEGASDRIVVFIPNDLLFGCSFLPSKAN